MFNATALAACQDLLGPENVITGRDSLEKCETTTFQVRRTVPAVLRPANRDEVQAVVELANRFEFPIYTVSSGRNWGYGSRVPSADGCVLVDLSRMNRILDFSEELAYVTVEPGVTQRQLMEFLAARKSNLWMDATGSGPECSLIGNTVERGFGHTPYGDHFANISGLEVVLGNGEVVETGFARFPNSRAAATYKWGVGPSIDGLFSQSNLGIVTRMTIWLMPAPEYFQAYCFRTDEEEGLGELVNALRPLRLNGTVRSSVHIANDYKVISSVQQYPWDLMQGQTPLAGPVMHELRKRLRIGRWNGSGALYGTKRQVAEGRRLIKRALAGKADKLQFLDDFTLRLAGRFAKPFQLVTGWDLSRALELLEPVYGLMKGIPTEKPMESLYWRKRTPPSPGLDPDRDRCGLIWCAPVCAATGSEAVALSHTAASILLRHAFEPAISVTLITDRSLACVVSITYDRDVPGEDERARACHADLLGSVTGRGWYPYRLGVQFMTPMAAGGGYNSLLSAVREAVDPNGILSPGRYTPKPVTGAASASAA